MMIIYSFDYFNVFIILTKINHNILDNTIKKNKKKNNNFPYFSLEYLTNFDIDDVNSTGFNKQIKLVKIF